MNPTSLTRYRIERHRDDAHYHTRELTDLIDKVGGCEITSLYAKLATLIHELEADGFKQAAFHGRQALPALKQAELHLERAKGRIR